MARQAGGASWLRKRLYKLKRQLIPHRKFASIPEGICFPLEARPRVLLLASNNVDHDTRVKKTAASLRGAGYNVGILGVTKAGAVHAYDDPSLARVVYDDLYHRIYFRRELRELNKIDVRRSELQSQIKASKKLQSSLSHHDDLLLGISDHPSILFKLATIVRQRWRLKSAVAAPRKAAILKRKFLKYNAYRNERRAIIRARMARRNFKSSRFYNAAKHFNYYSSFRGSIAPFSPDIIHANDLLTLPSAIKYKQKNPSVRVIYDAHELEMHRNKTYDFWRNVFDQIVEWYFIKKADAVITVSDGIADVIAKAYGIERPAVVLNAPSLAGRIEADGLRSRISAPPHAKLVTYVGIVAEGRGIDNLVRALAYLPTDHHVAIMGPRRADRDEFLQVIAGNIGASDRLHLVDPVRPHEVASVLADADMTINPSIRVCRSYDLALPNKLFDAVVAKVPNLVAELQEMKNFVEVTKTGICRNLETPESIASAISEMLTLRDNGYFDDTQWKRVAQEYCWEKQEKSLLSLYQDALTRSVPSEEVLDRHRATTEVKLIDGKSAPARP